MKVIFKGVYKVKKKGCGVCGQRSVSKRSFSVMENYFLPSGIEKTFRAGQVEELSDEDGSFLLKLEEFEEA